jgi:glycosyltransferase involved in cell wall biosynthesis
MRICLVTPGFSADADDWCIPALRHLAAGLVRAGHQVHVLAVRYPFRPGSYELSGIRVTAVAGAQRQNWSSVGVWRRAFAALAAEHRRRRFDVLQAFWATESGALAALAGRLLDVPTVVSLAGGELACLPDIGYGGQLALSERLTIRLALRLASAVTAGSFELVQRASPRLQGRPSARALRLPLGVDLSLFSPAPGPAAEPLPLRLIQVGSLIPVKDQVTLLQAAARLRRLGVEFSLEVVGAGPLAPQLATLAGELDLDRVVHLLGALPHHHLPQVYRTGAVYVCSSSHEAQGMAPLEAAACGLPVVGTNVGILPELSPEAAIVTPVGDPSALADALAGLLGDRQRRCTMGRSARSKVEQEFGVERCTERFGDLHRALAQTSRR